MHRSYSVEGALTSLAPLSGTVTQLFLEEKLSSDVQAPKVFDSLQAVALGQALGGLHTLSISWGVSISGPAVAMLLYQMPLLESLVLHTPCDPPAALEQPVLIDFALAEALRGQPGERTKPVQILLTGRWSMPDAQAAMAAVKAAETRLLKGVNRAMRLTVKVDSRIMHVLPEGPEGPEEGEGGEAEEEEAEAEEGDVIVLLGGPEDEEEVADEEG